MNTRAGSAGRASRWLTRLASLAFGATTCTAISAGSALLRFDAPATNTDGSPIAGPLSYRASWRCGAGPGYPNQSEPFAPTSYRVDGLPDAGTCRFVVSAIDSAGVESAHSNEAQKVMGVLAVPGSPGLAVTWAESPPEPPVTFSIVQTESDSGQAKSRTTTLPGASTNGNYLLVAYTRVIAGSSPTAPDVTAPDPADWAPLIAQTLTTEAGAYALAKLLLIDDGQNSATVEWTSGGSTENSGTVLVEIGHDGDSIEMVDSAILNTGGDFDVIALPAVTAQEGDLIVAVGQLHDNDLTIGDAEFTNGFQYLDGSTTGQADPDSAIVAGYLIAPSDGDYSTTISWPTPPGSDQCDGFILVLREITEGGGEIGDVAAIWHHLRMAKR